MCTVLFTDSIFIVYLDCGRNTLLQLPFILLVITFLNMSISKVHSSGPTFLCYLFLQHNKPFLGHISAWNVHAEICPKKGLFIVHTQSKLPDGCNFFFSPTTNTVSMQASTNMLLIHKLNLTTINVIKTYLTMYMLLIHSKNYQKKIYKTNHNSNVLFCR
jgi:hypothetical protein